MTKCANDTKPSGTTKHYLCFVVYHHDGLRFCLATCENLE